MLAYGRACSDAALVVAAPQPSPAAQGDARDAARYAIVRRGQHWSVIDAAIDAALAVQGDTQ